MSTRAAKARLTFRDWHEIPDVNDPLRHDMSSVAVCGDAIFVACDETASVESLVRTKRGTDYDDHRHFALGDFFDLPDGPDGEMDIEGLAIADGYLWITGSHSLKRDRPKRDEHGATKALERMLEIDRDPNRYFLGCVPVDTTDGEVRLARKSGSRRAACIELKKRKSRLVNWLRRDDHIGPFLDIPSKENGFDVEGIAAKGSRVWLGCRGPVLRGYGVILELDLKRPKASRLEPRRIDGKHRHRKHLLDTRGLGIRDLCFDGTDLLVLVGKPLASDGPAHVLRWRDAAYDTTSGVVDPERVSVVLELPYGHDADHPEGIALLEEGAKGAKRLLVVYDSPAASRLSTNPARLTADIFRLEG